MEKRSTLEGRIREAMSVNPDDLDLLQIEDKELTRVVSEAENELLKGFMQHLFDEKCFEVWMEDYDWDKIIREYLEVKT